MAWRLLQAARSLFISKDSRGSFMAKRLITGLFIALVVSCIFTFWLGKKFAKPVSTAPPVKVQYVAASKALDAGEVLSPEDRKMVAWPTSQPLEGAFAK